MAQYVKSQFTRPSDVRRLLCSSVGTLVGHLYPLRYCVAAEAEYKAGVEAAQDEEEAQELAAAARELKQLGQKAVDELFVALADGDDSPAGRQLGAQRLTKYFWKEAGPRKFVVSRMVGVARV